MRCGRYEHAYVGTLGRCVKCDTPMPPNPRPTASKAEYRRMVARMDNPPVLGDISGWEDGSPWG